MGEVKGRRDINNELTKLHSEKVEERSVGLARLTQIIKEKRQDLKQINDTGYHNILETVFRVAKLECSNYVKATKYTKSKIESRLSGCATLVRVVVEVGLRKLRHKTVKALIEHITQTLPTADAGYCAPLCKDYFKALATLLEFKAHPEHFLGDEWHEVVDFCLDTARDLNKSHDANESGSTNGVRKLHGSASRRDNLSRSATPSTTADHGRLSSFTASQPAAYPQIRDSQLEIALCLQHLVTVANVPIFDRANIIVFTVMDLLDSYAKVAAIQQVLFECINSIMSRVIANDVGLALQIVTKTLSLFRRFWDVKDNTMKEPLLVFLSYTEVLLARLILDDTTGDRKAELGALVEALREDYCARRYREQLQLDDLSPVDPVQCISPRAPLSNSTLKVRMGAFKAEQAWCLLSSSAAVVVALESDTIAQERTVHSKEHDLPLKRQRLTHPLDDIFSLTKGSVRSEKLYALQVLVFVFDIMRYDENVLQNHLDVLLRCLSDDDGLIASWAMFAMTSAASQPAARSSSLKTFWPKIWRLAARHITSSSTCRAACHLTTCLLGSGLTHYRDVVDLVDAMIRSVDLNGPAECDESAATLWTMLLFRRSRENLGSTPETSENILRWLFNRWSPAKLPDRHQATHKAQSVSTFSNLRLICTCLGLPPPLTLPLSLMNLGALAQTRFKISRDQKMMEYLLLAREKPTPFQEDSCSKSKAKSDVVKLMNPNFKRLASNVMEFLITNGSALLQHHFPSAAESMSGISRDIVQICISFTIIGYGLLSSPNFQENDEQGQLESILHEMSRGLKHCMLYSNNQRELLGGVFDSFGAVLPPIDGLLSGDDLLTSGVIKMCKEFDQTFWKETLHPNDLANTDTDHDVLDIDHEFDSQRSRSREETFSSENAHCEVQASTNAAAFRACVAAKICLMSKMGPSKGREVPLPRTTSSVLEYFTALQGHEFIACRAVILELLESGTPLLEDDAATLLQYLAEVLLRSYEYERSEVSMGVILDVMTSLADLWTTNTGSEISQMGEVFYSWFIDTALKKAILSPFVHIRISVMLRKIIKVRPEYGKSILLPSARTSLFKVLRDGDIVVKFYIGSNIADIFGLFILKEHEHILEDVLDSLPSTSNWIEGIALRLFVLSHLAASWSTLLRRCIYAILECPRHVPESAGYAKSCLTHITASLNLAKSKDLFKLFVPQIFFTWLEAAEPLKLFPYAIFGYRTLLDLLHDVQDEIVGQIIMREKDDEADQLSDELNTPFKDLLNVSFSKASAYCIARDVGMAPAKGSQASHAEIRMRNIIEKEKYDLLAVENFPSILVTFFKTIDPAGQIEKGFQNHDWSSEAYSVYKDILNKSGPDKNLPANQQPSIKAKHLPDEIKYLCYRTNYDPEALWTPELYVYTFREIFSSIHGALGSLHACSILRRIRILISMVGNVALEQYPLELGLQSLKPYLTDVHCAEEAIGLVQYLLEHGASYLREVPSFLAGNAVSTLTSMKAFFESTQDSTTQESQFQATMSRAQNFHIWFSTYLRDYKSTQLSEDSAKSFTVITNAATHIQTGGNAKAGTYESELLLEVLEDQRSGRDLLDRSCRDSIMNFLCASFEVPSNFRDDILGSDERASQYAAVVWKTCQRCISSESYRLWAGRVLGRAYAGRGLIDREMVNETSLEPTIEAASSQTTTASSSSRNNLLKLLCDILHGESSSEIGMAESTLRSIITKTDGTEDFLECNHCLPSSLRKSLLWRQFHLPEEKVPSREGIGLQESAVEAKTRAAEDWIQRLCVALVLTITDDPILSELASILKSIEGLAEKAFPYVLHLVLLEEANGHQKTKSAISERCHQMFQECIDGEDKVVSSVRILLRAILYLRTQSLPNETSKDDRAQWLTIDYKQAAAAAIKCSMFKTALLFLEVDFSTAAKSSRRASAIKTEEPSDLLLAIYEKIDEQDAFYGVQQPSGLASMMARLDYENAGFKSLSFRGAHYDGQLRSSGGEHRADEESIVRALDNLDLNGLSQSLLSKMTSTGPTATDSVLRTARKLEQWEISAPTSRVSTASTLFKAFQGINSAADNATLTTSLNTGFTEAMDQLTSGRGAKSAMHEILGSLAILTEADEIFSSRKSDQLFEVIGRFEARYHWMHSESYEHIKGILSCRETALSILSKKSKLQDLLKTTQRDARSAESQLLLASSHTSRLHGALQNALSTATYLTQLVTPCQKVGIDISAAVQFESAHVLWGQGEMTASIKMLQDLNNSLGSHSQLAKVGKSELLATLGHHISEARLEKPDEIINQYLIPAIKELHGRAEGDEAGQVFHEFASFCDQQLQNPDGLEDFHRIRKLRERKEAEVEDLNRMMKTASSQARERENLKSYRNKAKAWFDLDDREFQRLRGSRETFLRQSLENYLLCLRACDEYDKDALRFSALWLENYDSDIANQAVSKYVDEVGSRKFAALMNQWSSRLLESDTHFQKLLASLVLRICIDHPYHGMYQIFAGSKSKGGKDEKALARNAAANNIVQQLKSNKRSASTWLAVHNTNICFVRFASERSGDSSIKPGSKVSLRKSTTGQRVEQEVQNQRIPPPTAKIELRADCDYSDIPFIARFQPEFTVASGISMPKILTAIGTDGLKYKQLFKGGNDDLRQDSIMEQVFEQVSNLLRTQRATRQRNLGIRTYKVLPLTATTGIIEFVPDTTPLHDYLLPAHQRHFPKDLKPNNCRKHISDAQNKSVDQRIKTFRSVCEHFHPVLRYFFMERFENPDDWFEKRLAYTRSTAAISILGHILGLGDRHGHNILLDEKTGEVVHIDLGIAFEQGRILPVPEVVPFRLTRDLVDGMGITKTEGVFRRCCEFTLEALRNESYSIMTILDVLRYDPLYSWSVSPLRLKKMQDAQTEDPKLPGAGGDGPGRGEAEPGEADRALMVVKKKLSKSLSVQATVNELIQMATDERNLAVLFCGWAAYA